MPRRSPRFGTIAPPQPAVATQPPPTETIPAPPAFYARPPYTPGYAFQGRAKELAALHDWAGSADSVMLFEAIGGMGKSMVTWEWVTKCAEQDRPGWAGILWYSFYERGADLRDFCATALAYITETRREDLATRPAIELADQLLPLLRARRWLLVLDGLERVLVAYNRSDAAQLRDEEAETSSGATGAAPTDCIRPDDGDLLRQLCAAGPSKLLISSRLMPRVLLNAFGQPVPGVRRLQLLGLDPRDAEAMLREAGITGDSERMRRYLEQRFGGHPLVVGIVGGLVLKHLKAAGDFDRWLDDPQGGGAVNLADPDIRQRQNHILKLAFDGLAAQQHELLARIAMIADAVDWDTLEALNPARPSPPEEVEEPSAPDLERDLHVRFLRLRLAAANTQKQRVDLERQISVCQHKLQANYRSARQAYGAYQATLAAWRGSEPVRAATRWLNDALLDLETRGLLQCDRRAQKVDLHPVVRGYAIASLGAEARAQTGQQVADHFAARLAPAFATATSLLELANAMQTVQALNLAGRTPAAWQVLRGELVSALYRLERNHELLALLQPLFPSGWFAPPDGVADRTAVATVAALALEAVGSFRAAAAQQVFDIRESAKDGVGRELSNSLQNHSEIVARSGELAQSERVLDFAREVAVATADEQRALWCEIFLVRRLIDRGALIEARAHWSAIATRLPDAIRLRGQLEALALRVEAWLLFREGALTDETLCAAIAHTHALGEAYYERELLRLSGTWQQSAGRDAGAAAAFVRAIEMAHEAGLRDTESEARRGLSLTHLGRRQEAEAAATAAERDPPHAPLAELYLALGERDKARQHALAGYKRYWADGPPYAFHWPLQTCRTVLEALDEKEPQLPPFDPTKVAPIEYEADIRHLLAEYADKQQPKPS